MDGGKVSTPEIVFLVSRKQHQYHFWVCGYTKNTVKPESSSLCHSYNSGKSNEMAKTHAYMW